MLNHKNHWRIFHFPDMIQNYICAFRKTWVFSKKSLRCCKKFKRFSGKIKSFQGEDKIIPMREFCPSVWLITSMKPSVHGGFRVRTILLLIRNSSTVKLELRLNDASQHHSIWLVFVLFRTLRSARHIINISIYQIAQYHYLKTRTGIHISFKTHTTSNKGIHLLFMETISQVLTKMRS